MGGDVDSQFAEDLIGRGSQHIRAIRQLLSQWVVGSTLCAVAAHVLGVQQLLRRPELSYGDVMSLAPNGTIAEPLPADVTAQVEVSVKYSGYVKRQQDAVDRFKRLEGTRIPESLDYGSVSGLSREARERLAHIRPRSLGQAARVPGVTPAALSLLSVHLKRYGSL